MHAIQRTLRPLTLAVLMGCASLAHAQAAAPIDAEKQKLIDQVIALWHPENSVVALAQQPAQAALTQSRIALEQKQLPKAKIEAALKDILVDAQKYADTVTPLVAASAKKNMGSSVVPLLAQNFSTDELKQLLALLQSPIRAKFDKVAPQASQALGEKVQADVGAEVNKNAQALQASAGTKLRAAATATN